MHFKGEGSSLIAADGDIFYSQESKFGRDQVSSGTLSGWVYIDEWKEGAIIFSKYNSDNECITFSLGDEDTKELKVNVNGSVASLKNKVNLNQWHYLSMHLAPTITALSNTRISYKIMKIGVDCTVYHALNDIKLSGNDMTTGVIPSVLGAPIIIGKDFSGKIDELKVWGSDRESNLKSDSEEPYRSEERRVGKEC